MSKQTMIFRASGRKATAVGLAGVLALLVLAAGAWAGGGKKGIEPVKRSDAAAGDLAEAIVQGHQDLVVNAKFVTIPPGGAPVAVGTKPINAFPRTGGAFAILSTGCAMYALRPNNSNGAR